MRPTLRQMGPDEDTGALLALIRDAFAYMDGRIDPPSSMHRLSRESLAREAETGEVWVLEHGRRPVACMILTLRPDALHLGKLAVAGAWRGQGLARRLADHAVLRAGHSGRNRVELQTRVELTENHAAFAALGFRKVGETAHPGYDRPTSVTFARDVERPNG